ncbi:uncharacterized protein EKO05_0010514 [Ascochyta rabiei]|uniref:uncharacterized protein n=1 Tax=Didymella rabiei TaxID=5454 RepID=UPI0022055EB1|nr:uncharacterized protein EKO05_0010514 [Ascochyta rabiei]UPX20277.1 hypothetical protein EKO05_0010514 [Ascochyta rabiei]
MTSLLSPPMLSVTNQNLRYAEPHVIDFQSLQAATIEGAFDQSLFEVLKNAAPTGLLHIVNHGLDPSLFQKLRAITYTYMMTATAEEKDAASTVNGTGSFEGYKPRTDEEKRKSVLPVIEEYNYDYHSSGTINRPKLIKDNEEPLSKIFNFYHQELTPHLLDFIGKFCGLQPGVLRQTHEESSEVAHLLLYHPRWYEHFARKRAAYAGHTDIGSLTYLYANPVASLQVYGTRGWEYVAYIPNSIVVNMGDAMQFLTKGMMNATLHRVIKPTSDQNEAIRTALVYFVHPNHSSMSASLSHFQQLRAHYTRETKKSPGCLINGMGLNRVISSLSAIREDPYLSLVDYKAWESSRNGGLVASPREFCVNFETLAVNLV